MSIRPGIGSVWGGLAAPCDRFKLRSEVCALEHHMLHSTWLWERASIMLEGV